MLTHRMLDGEASAKGTVSLTTNIVAGNNVNNGGREGWGRGRLAMNAEEFPASLS